jgi:hypothetical protein
MSTVIEAIRVATERNSRVPDCLARIVHAKLLLSGTSDQKVLGYLELEHARALMQETGAAIFKPMLESPMDELREAQPAAKAN